MNEPAVDRIRSVYQISDDEWDALVAAAAAIETWEELWRRMNEAVPDSAEKAVLLEALDFRMRVEARRQ